MTESEPRRYNDIRAHVDTVDIRSTTIPRERGNSFLNSLLFDRLTRKEIITREGGWQNRVDPNRPAIGAFNESAEAREYNALNADSAVGIQRRIELLLKLGGIADDGTVSRIDLAIDNNEGDFGLWCKMNRYLHLLFIEMYKIPIRDRHGNGDEVTHAKTGFRARKCNKHGYLLEMEIYNKAIQNPEADVKTRVELRKKQLKGYSVIAVCTAWITILRKLMAYAPAVQRKQNEQLNQEWLKYQCESTEAIKPQEFIRRSSGYIFARKQLIDLYRRMGVKNPSAKTGDFLKRNKLELCENATMERYIGTMIAAIEKFRDTPAA